ncbi:uncharacterized protein [Anabrus simplex]
MVETGMADTTDHGGSPTVRTCELDRADPAAPCGFNLTRSRWDPYPWVSGVDAGSAAEVAGLRPGDCVLEVNGEDVLGERISTVAARVRAHPERVSLLLWNAGVDPQCHPESLCCGPMPGNLQRLSTCLGSILAVLECPVCLDTIPPPAHQCSNGHLICVRCRVQTERCPVCRVRFCRGRSLLADQVFNSLTEAFQLKDEAEEVRPAKLRERLFGNKKKPLPAPSVDKSSHILPPTNKFLARIMGKSSSVENLSSNPVTLTSIPKHLSLDTEFNSTLKAKSLSTSEIFRPLSPAVSRSPSMQTGLHLRSSRPASYHGSLDSLTGRLSSDFGDSLIQMHDDGSLYHCPCSAECTTLLKANGVMAHIQDYHDGPLVQYFKSRVLLSLPLPLEDSAVVAISAEGAMFFLSLVKEADGSWLVWLWMLGSKREADTFRMVLTLRGGAHEVTYNTPVLSLSSASWADITKSQRGVHITKEKLDEHFPAEIRTGCPLGMLVVIQEAVDDGCTKPVQ